MIKNRKTIKNDQLIIYTAGFLILTAVCRISFWHRGIVPIYGIDGLGQYYPVFLYIGQFLRSLFMHPVDTVMRGTFDLAVGMGEDIIGTLNYYGFGDPVNLLAVFATKQTGPYVFALSYHLRLYLGGLCFILYCRRFDLDRLAVIAGALCYAFCGYAVYAAGMYIQYGSMLYVFPLLLLGCEEVLKGEGKPRWLVLAAWYLGLCGFYFTYICAVFLPVYCIVRSCFIYGRSNVRRIAASCINCALMFLLGIGLSAPIFIPTLLSFMSSDRSGADPLRALVTLSNYIPALNRRFVADANIMDALRNYPVLIAAAGSFFIPASRRIVQIRAAVVSLFVLLYLPVTGIVFNGFADPRDRWVFEAQFVLCVAFAVVLSEMKDDRFRKLYRAALILSVANIVIAFWGRYSSLGDDRKDMYVTVQQARDETLPVTDGSEIIAQDKDLYRISGDMVSAVNGRPLNTGMISGYYGTGYWFSVVNANTQKYVDDATKVSNDWRSFGLGNMNLPNTMAGVKYYISDGGDAPEGFERVETIQEGKSAREVYENREFAGFAYYKDPEGRIYDSSVDCVYDSGNLTCRIGDAVPAGSSAFIAAIPYSAGWRAYVDGVGVVPKNDSCLVAIDPALLHKGSVIVLRYVTPGLYAGFAVAGLCAAICIVLFVINIRKKVENYDTGK